MINPVGAVTYHNYISWRHKKISCATRVGVLNQPSLGHWVARVGSDLERGWGLPPYQRWSRPGLIRPLYPAFDTAQTLWCCDDTYNAGVHMLWYIVIHTVIHIYCNTTVIHAQWYIYSITHIRWYTHSAWYTQYKMVHASQWFLQHMFIQDTATPVTFNKYKYWYAIL